MSRWPRRIDDTHSGIGPFESRAQSICTADYIILTRSSSRLFVNLQCLALTGALHAPPLRLCAQEMLEATQAAQQRMVASLQELSCKDDDSSTLVSGLEQVSRACASRSRNFHPATNAFVGMPSSRCGGVC